MRLRRLVWCRDDPPFGVHLMMRNSAVPKTNSFLVGSEDEKFFVAHGLQDFLVERNCGLVVLGGDAQLGVIDHVGGLMLQPVDECLLAWLLIEMG